MEAFEFRAKVWLYPGEAAWHFITVPKGLSKEIKLEFGAMARGWGSLPVSVQIGGSKWITSIFPDSKSNTYLLPVKSEIRKREKIVLGDNLQIGLTILTEKL